MTPRTPAPHRPSRTGFATPAAALAIFLGAVLVGLLLFSASGGAYTVKARFQNAGQLVTGNEVRIGGTAVGSVEAIRLTDSGLAEIELSLDDEAAPLHEGTRARIRASSLSGIANRYVALDPGRNDAPEIPDGGVVEIDGTQAPVDLDQLFATLDEETRAGLQQVIQGFAAQYAGRGRQAGRALEYLDPALSRTAALMDELTRDSDAFESFVVDNARLVQALAERRGELADLVSNANTTSTAIASENTSLARALDLLPTTLRRANTTFVNLRSTLDDLDPLVAETKTATRDLAPFLRRLRPLVTDATPTIEDLRLLIRRPGTGNDLIELVRKMPRLADLAETVWPRTIRALDRSLPVLEYIRPYTPDLAAWISKFGQSAAPYDANGHYARVQPIFNAFSYTETPAGPVYSAAPPVKRLEGLEARRNQRCPGASVQPPPDGSAPWKPAADFDCDPAIAPPGP